MFHHKQAGTPCVDDHHLKNDDFEDNCGKLTHTKRSHAMEQSLPPEIANIDHRHSLSLVEYKQYCQNGDQEATRFFCKRLARFRITTKWGPVHILQSNTSANFVDVQESNSSFLQ